jgi:type IV fimbrial biogenesis protein FimT
MEKGHSRGFTLTEVMMAIAVAAIVLTIGVPSFRTMILNSRKNTAIGDLQTSLIFARSSAITLRKQITVCKSIDNTNCTQDSDIDWSRGWLVFLDPDRDGTRSGGEKILRAHGALKGDVTYAGNTPVKDRVSFTPQGGFGNGIGGTITYTDSRGADYGGKLVISFGGQVKYEDNSTH